MKDKVAKLTLIGAGPGDPELLTIKAFKALQDADVILYDALVNPHIFDLLSQESKAKSREPSRIENPELIYVGKCKGESHKQQEINTLILNLLSQGKNIARLKGGDPFIFARGVEEIEIAQSHGYDYEIIPGLTSGLALASANAITLTLREKSDSVLFATGHEVNREKLKTWTQILKQGSTLIIYMGLGQIVEIVEDLALHFDADFPVIAIANGSQENEIIIKSELGEILQELIDKSIDSPVIFYIGQHIKYINTELKSFTTTLVQW